MHGRVCMYSTPRDVFFKKDKNVLAVFFFKESRPSQTLCGAQWKAICVRGHMACFQGGRNDGLRWMAMMGPCPMLDPKEDAPFFRAELQ